MKPNTPVLVGIIIAIVVCLAGLLTPWMRSSTRKIAMTSQDQAVLAMRELAHVDQELPRVADLIDVEALKAANYGDLQSQAAALAEEMKLERESLERVKSAASIEQAVKDFGARVQRDSALLTTAINDAKKAVDDAGAAQLNPIGVAHVQGMAYTVRAAEILAGGEDLRRQQADAQARLVKLATEWKLTEGNLDEVKGLDVDPIVDKLNSDLKEISGLRDEARAAVQTLKDQIDGAEAKLAQVKQELDAARQQRLSLENTGFVAGNDDSFNAYRTRYVELTQKLRQLQEQEQELQDGGLRGAELTGDDLATAEIKAGEPVIGLEELKRRYQTAQDKAKRFDNANVSLEERVKFLQESGEQATAEVKRYQARLNDLDVEQKTVYEEVDKLDAAAKAKEVAALTDAAAARDAFAQSARAIDALRSGLLQVQSESDPDRKNEMINAVLRDGYLQQAGKSAEASAWVLVGRIHLERVEACQRLIDDMRVIGEMNAKVQFNPADFRTLLDTARTAGIDALGKARDLYEGLTKTPNTTYTVWVPLAALAGVEQLLARLDVDKSAEHAANAAKFIGQAVGKREQNPYLQPFVRFRDSLGVAAMPPAEQEGGGTSQPAEKEGGEKQ